jgi:hypothetical protein
MKEATAKSIKIDLKRKSPTTETRLFGSASEHSSGSFPSEESLPASVASMNHVGECSSEGVFKCTLAQSGEGRVTTPIISLEQELVTGEDDQVAIQIASPNRETYADDKVRVSFSNQVSVKTIPDCWDYLQASDEEMCPSSSSLTTIAVGSDQQQEGDTLSCRTDRIREVPLKTSTNPFLPDPSVYKAMLKPIPQRPIHPKQVKVQCVTNASRPTGPRISSSSGPASRRKDERRTVSSSSSSS